MYHPLPHALLAVRQAPDSKTATPSIPPSEETTANTFLHICIHRHIYIYIYETYIYIYTDRHVCIYACLLMYICIRMRMLYLCRHALIHA